MFHSAIGCAVKLAIVASVAAVGAIGPLRQAAAQNPSTNLQVQTLAQGLTHPWSLAFLPDGRMLVTERPGRLRIIEPSGELSPPITGTPAVAAMGQGGLLDVALGPDFAATRLVYLSYAEPGEEGTNGTAVLRGRLSDDATALEAVQVIFRQEPKVRSTNHFGSRLAFAPDGRLFVTLGDRFSFRDQAQNPASAIGKIVRIEADGGIPRDNPFVDREGFRPEIWSMGHRNAQAAAINPQTGLLWTVEHGARGGDEVNIPQPGRNYGWPIISYGRDYSGAKIGVGTSAQGLEQPVYYWDPSIAPSGMAFYSGALFPQWRGNLFVGGLAGMTLVRLTLDGERVTGEERLLRDLRQRIRDVRQGPDGALYVLTDSSNGRLLRLSPG